MIDCVFPAYHVVIPEHNRKKAYIVGLVPLQTTLDRATMEFRRVIIVKGDMGFQES